MSEIQTNAGRNGLKGKKLSTRVDLTPMVDLGFLLISFFIFTTALAKPSVMKLTMPDDTPNAKPITSSEEKTLTLLVAKENRLYYYSGIFKGLVQQTSFKQIRDVIIEKKQQVFKKYGSSNLTILIKVSNEAIFKNIVDSLDEMVINGISTYMLVEPEARDLQAIK